ncbi:hypothetical protein AAW50_01065 [Mycoplasmopsis canis]|uniref:hypothetical protein n=1 Tax=Mycoplasmopsis canis TaxID=29555 RepID=UPI000624DBFB|nr:hypothetical protein [Mycoplasmopsis canis]AKF41029.1 hypothetical protein AAW50_01065 [Mycoplasmopsis canis]
MAKTNDELFKSNFILSNSYSFNSIFGVGKEFSIPDSKTQFENDGAVSQQTQLANALPKIELENKNELLKFLNKNYFLEIIQKMEVMLYKKGLAALGVLEGKVIVLGEVFDYAFNFENELVFLKVSLGKRKIKNELFEVIYEYDLNEPYIKKYGINTITKKTITARELFGNNYKQELNVLNFIPWTIFKNKADEAPDIEMINPELFEMLNAKYKSLILDMYLSLPIPQVQWNVGGTKADQIVKNLFSLDNNRTVKIDSKATISALGDNFDIKYAPTQAPQIITTIENLKHWIKKSLLLKKDGDDGGTSNKHNAEIATLNSDYDDYIEMKANLREIYYENFFRMLLKLLDLDFEQDIDVIVVSSTKWLQEQASIAQTNQQGITLSNPQQNKTSEPEKEIESE